MYTGSIQNMLQNVTRGEISKICIYFKKAIL